MTKIRYTGGAADLTTKVSPAISRAMLKSTRLQPWGKEAFILPNGHIGIIGLPLNNPVTKVPDDDSISAKV